MPFLLFNVFASPLLKNCVLAWAKSRSRRLSFKPVDLAKEILILFQLIVNGKERVVNWRRVVGPHIGHFGQFFILLHVLMFLSPLLRLCIRFIPLSLNSILQ